MKYSAYRVTDILPGTLLVGTTPNANTFFIVDNEELPFGKQFAATDLTSVPVWDGKSVIGTEQDVAPPGATAPTMRTVVTSAFSPAEDLILIRRVATLMRVVKL